MAKQIDIFGNVTEQNPLLRDKFMEPPRWICGDSDKELDVLDGAYDLLFTCPPYANLEVYSKMPDDLSNMSYIGFSDKYRSILTKATKLIKHTGFAVVVIGNVRDKKTGFYMDLVGLTNKIMYDAGWGLYNDFVVVKPYGTAMLRTRQFEASQKLVKVHENILVYKKY